MYKIVAILMCLLVAGCVSQQDPITGETTMGLDPNKMADIDTAIVPWLPVASALAGLWPGWGWALAIAGAGYAAIKKFKIIVPPKPEEK